MPLQDQTSRLYSLDLLRGIAVILVLLRHMPMWGTTRSSVESVMRAIHDAGWMGVDLFFVLSGFLISGLLFKELNRNGAIALSRFWIRRGMKIWPSYFAAYGGTMLLATLADLLSGKSINVLGSFLSAWPNFIFIQNYFPASQRWSHSWSIAIEEHFYLALPIVLAALYGRRKRVEGSSPPVGMGYICGAVCVGVLCLRLLFAANPQNAWDYFYYPTHFRADSLSFGVLLGYLHSFHRTKFQSLAKLWPGYLALAIVALSLATLFPLERSRFSYTLGFTIFYLAFGGLVVSAGGFPDFGSTGPRATVWATKALAFMGVYSYTIYLAHSVVYDIPGVIVLRALVLEAFGDSVWSDRLLFWLLSILGGVLLSSSVERPFLRLRHRWFPQPLMEK